MTESREPRPLHGIVLIDKPSGSTSNRVLQQVKRLFNAAKAGHTGSLDPMATGMLPVCFGAATRVSGVLLEASKCYRVTARLGTATDTGDADGKPIDSHESGPLQIESVETALRSMLGESHQIPPMYSALKQGGRRLYELARRGEEVPRPARRITIHEIELEGYDWPEFRFRVVCSKGTYVRTLVADVAVSLGTLGHVAGLRRLWVSPYEESRMVTLEAIVRDAARGLEALDSHLLGIDSALVELPSVSLDGLLAERLGHGQRIGLDPAHIGRSSGQVRVYGPDGLFVGIGEVDSSGELKPKRLFLV